MWEGFKSVKMTHLEIDISSLYLLAAPGIDSEVRERVIERAEEGEPVTRGAVKRERDAKPQRRGEGGRPDSIRRLERYADLCIMAVEPT